MNRFPPSSRLLRASAGACLALLTCMGALPGGLSAQAGASDPGEELPDLLSALRPNAGLRVVTMAGVVEEGALTDLTALGLEVTRDGVEHRIAFPRVRSVAVRGGHGVQGAVWGAASGALVGVFFGALIASFDCRSQADCEYSERQGALRLGLVLAGVGGGTGFVFGRRDRHWHPVFP